MAVFNGEKENYFKKFLIVMAFFRVTLLNFEIS